MCGICGTWGSGDGAVVAAMVAAMPHRGPDDRGVMSDEHVVFGMTRLAILDPTPRGHQPMTNHDGSVWIVYNGEIFDHAAQRTELEAAGRRFRSGTDTEVVLALYERYGAACITRLRGMFACAIYDRRQGPGRERLILARDPFGIKPLLYAWCGDRLVFASEMKAILASGLVAREVDHEALRGLLTFGSVVQPRTMIRGVSMLPPAHVMTVERSGSRLERYWSPAGDRRPELHGVPYPEQLRELSRVVNDSLRRQLVSDVPLGAFLSGGIDSSLLVALMTRHAAGRVTTFSVGFADAGSELDESSDAERIARHLGTDHRHVVVAGDAVASCLPAFVRGLDQPSVDGLNTYLVATAAAPSVTVAISGTGGDELFAGYPWFRAAQQWCHARHRHPLATLLRSARGELASRRWWDRAVGSRFSESLCGWREQADLLAFLAPKTCIFGVRGAARVLAADIRSSAHAGRALRDDLRAADLIAAGTVLQRVSAATLAGYTANQLLRDIDATSMAHSLEVRVPLLDTVVADTALALPDATKLKPPAELTAVPAGGSYRATGAKRILVDVGRSLLPPDLDALPKRGFTMPIGAWLAGPLRETLLDALAPPAVAARGLLDPAGVAAVAADFLAGRCDWQRPWLLMVLELWCREVVDRPPGGRP